MGSCATSTAYSGTPSYLHQFRSHTTLPGPSMAGITNTTASTMALATSAAGTMCPAHIQAKQASSATTPSDQVTPASTTPEPDARVDPAKEDWPIDPQLLGDAAAANTNLRLERAKANSEKKRKPEGKNAPSASKKQKTRADGLAIPDNANSIRYVSYFEAIPFNASFQKHIHATLECSASRRSRSCRRLRCILQDTVSRRQGGNVDSLAPKISINADHPTLDPQPLKKELRTIQSAAVRAYHICVTTNSH
jgi:hypothetical protein